MPVRRVRRCYGRRSSRGRHPFPSSSRRGLLSQSIHVQPRMDHYRKLQRPHLARWRRTLCPPLHESTSLAALLRHFRSVLGRVAAAVTPYPPFRCRCTPDKESRASAPRYFILSPCTPKGGLQAARSILSRSVLHSASTTHPLHSPHLFRGLAAQRDCSFRSGVRSSHRRSSHRLAQRYPYRDVYVRTRYPGLRSCIRVPSSWFPRSRRSPRSPSSEPLQPLQLHTQHQLVRAAGLLRFTVTGIVP